MAYADFTLEAVEAAFGLVAKPGDLFPGIAPEPVPAWLRESLDRNLAAAAVTNEKSRSEFLVTPILIAAREYARGDFALFSGQRLDVDPARGLIGECDFILARTPPIPRLKAPLMMIVEAKRGDIEAALGQGVAQVVGAKVFNERAGEPCRAMYGCVTSAEVWQFFRLEGDVVFMDRTRLFFDNLGGILAALRAIVEPPR